jgi:hypothetical protein
MARAQIILRGREPALRCVGAIFTSQGLHEMMHRRLQLQQLLTKRIDLSFLLVEQNGGAEIVGDRERCLALGAAKEEELVERIGWRCFDGFELRSTAIAALGVRKHGASLSVAS